MKMLLSALFVTVLCPRATGNVLPIRTHGDPTTNELASPWYNFFMDLVLDELKEYLKANHDTVIEIPPVTTGFEYDVIGIPFRGWFNATGGKFTNPATIKREGEVSVKHSTDKIVASMSVSFSELEVSFQQYIASVIGIEESGIIDVSISNNSVLIEISLRFIPHCVVSVSRLEVTRLSGIDVTMTGLGVLNPLESDIVAWVIQSYRTSFTELVETLVQNKLQEELAKTRICKLKKNVHLQRASYVYY